MQLQTSNTHTRTYIAGLFLAFVSALIIPFHTTHALTVSPARIEVSAKAGEKITGQFHVINEQGGASTFYSSAENFEAQGETGTPSFVSSTGGLSSWISLAPQITLKGGEEQVIPFSITIPKDADAGGHFAAIFLSTTPVQKGNTTVNVGAKIGVLVLLHVAGDIKESAGLLSFSTLDGQRFFSSLPVTLMYRFNNDGNDRVEPEGNIAIKNTVRWTTATISANPSQGNVLPGSIRRFEINWNTDTSVAPTSGFWSKVSYEWNHFAFGIYTAQLSLTYGSQKTPAASSFTFFVFPWHLLFVIVITLLVIGFVVMKGIKRYNQYIIKLAQRQQ